MEYKIVNGRVETRALEYHIVDHCNLRCDQCCSFSPMLKYWQVNPDQFEKDLLQVGKFVAPSFLKIVGGEPLLHSELPRLLKIAKKTGISSKVSVTTNAHLLNKLPDEAWETFEMLTVSIYPTPELSKETLKWIHQKAAAHNISVSWKTQDKFVNLNRSEKSNFEEAKETFQGCWIHHRCNSIKDGRFYSCTRPQYIQKIAGNPLDFKEDGVDLYAHPEEKLAELIKAHLESSEPLKTCFLCKGGQSHLSTQRQMNPVEITEQRETLVKICSLI
jgi:cyclic pyranopterin phosphate synthase